MWKRRDSEQEQVVFVPSTNISLSLSEFLHLLLPQFSSYISFIVFNMLVFYISLIFIHPFLLVLFSHKIQKWAFKSSWQRHLWLILYQIMYYYICSNYVSKMHKNPELHISIRSISYFKLNIMVMWLYKWIAELLSLWCQSNVIWKVLR